MYISLEVTELYQQCTITNISLEVTELYQQFTITNCVYQFRSHGTVSIMHDHDWYERHFNATLRCATPSPTAVSKLLQTSYHLTKAPWCNKHESVHTSNCRFLTDFTQSCGATEGNTACGWNYIRGLSLSVHDIHFLRQKKPYYQNLIMTTILRRKRINTCTLTLCILALNRYSILKFSLTWELFERYS